MTTYYVDYTGGLDSNNGLTSGTAWKTISKVNSTIASGDVVNFKKGETWSESITAVSGTVGNLTTYQAYGTGVKPIVKGFVANNKSYVCVDGLEVWQDNTTFPCYIYGGSNHITIRNCKVYGSATCGYWAALYLTNASYNIIEYNYIEHLNLTTQHDALCLDINSDYNVVRGNDLAKASHYAMSIQGASDSNPTATSEFNHVYGNQIHNDEGAVFQIVTNSHNNLVEDNVIYGPGKYTTLEQYPTLFKLVGENNIVRRNLLRDFTAATNPRGLALNSYWYGGTWPVNYTRYNHVYNNTLKNITSEATKGTVYVGAEAEIESAYNIIKNNIIYGNAGTYEINKPWITNSTPPPANEIHDNYFTNNIAYKSGVTNIVLQDGIARTIAGAEATEPTLWSGNIQDDPDLDVNFKPTSTSPGNNAGAHLTTVTSTNGSGTSFVVADSKYFWAGNTITPGDTIKVGSTLATITGINNSTNTITVSSSISWTNGANVDLPYLGTAPDIGAYELSEVTIAGSLAGTGSVAAGTDQGYTGSVISSASTITGANTQSYSGVVSGSGTINGSPVSLGSTAPWERRPELDITISPYNLGPGGESYFYLPYAVGTITGTLVGISIAPEPLIATASITGGYVVGKAFAANLTATGYIIVDLSTIQSNHNWVRWSKIGTLDFTLDRTNDAGYRPMEWNGWVYAVKPLELPTAYGTGSKGGVVVYGENGVTLMYPVSEPMTTFGFKELYGLGLLAKSTVTGDSNTHFFIDVKGQLCSVNADGVKVLGYSEYLNSDVFAGALPVMHYDNFKQRVYICNGVVGYVYTSSGGLGGGPINLTAVQRNGTSPVYSAPSTITYKPINIVTNATDCGVRGLKSIQAIIIEATDPTQLYFSVEVKKELNGPFVATPWKRFNKRGEGFVNKTGLEFRVKVKSLTTINSTIEGLKLVVRMAGIITEREALK